MGSFKATRAILVLFMGLAFLGSANAATKKNVVFVLIDALRADQIEGTRNGVPLMPYLNGLSAVRFKNATSPASWTLPAMASLFTSQYVDTHGVFAQGTALPANLQSMAAWFKQAGYSTVGIQTNGNLSAQRGFGQGFDQYDAIIDGFAENVTAHTLADTQSLTQPFFLYTHYLDPHMPYIPPQSYRALLGYPAPTLPPAEQAIAEDFIPYFWDHLDYVMGVKPAPTYPDLSPVGRDSVRALYDAEARYTDDQVRIMLEDILGRFPDTIVVILADHGDHFWEHNELGHEVTVYEPLVHVPLIIKAPGLAAASVTDLVETLDVLPTLADMLGMPAQPAWQGRSLFGPRNAQGPMFSCTKAGKDYQLDLHMVRQGSMKLICNRKTGALELYNLAPDPGETVNLATQQPALVKQLLTTLNLHLRQNARQNGEDDLLWAEPAGAVDEGMRVHLVAPEGVGYVWFRNGQPIDDNPPHLAGVGTQTLFIESLTVADSGEYECMYSDASQNLRITAPYTVDVLPVGSIPVFGMGMGMVLVVFFAGLGCLLLRGCGGETPGIQ